ncbi:MAG: imidazoleglycerol-phosphate dehydratase HisB [Clostridia bacterium]|nr:imidazoleglycerol-phosphate dehydratase HisB [Clostridia bacterium]MBR0327627.1 imidazoleglycerol-phosphate dehydratase HisB [Clostridia bacterium]
MRTSEVKRKTAETDIALTLNLDGSGASKIDSGCGFLDHMLTLFAKHGGFDLELTCKGDTYVDMHHTCEDIGISLGKAFYEALGDKRGITRYGDMILPMDEALILAAVDISGRGGYYADMEIPAEKVGDFDTELVLEYFTAFAQNAGITLHVRKLAGKNSHHIIEGAFKAVARALRTAVSIDAKNASSVPSTKGCL